MMCEIEDLHLSKARQTRLHSLPSRRERFQLIACKSNWGKSTKLTVIGGLRHRLTADMMLPGRNPSVCLLASCAIDNVLNVSGLVGTSWPSKTVFMPPPPALSIIKSLQLDIILFISLQSALNPNCQKFPECFHVRRLIYKIFVGSRSFSCASPRFCHSRGTRANAYRSGLRRCSSLKRLFQIEFN